jgi:hypothetical protein
VRRHVESGIVSKLAKGAIVVGHALVGWAYCGAIVGIGRQFTSMQTTLVVHAIGAPVGFFLLSLLYFRKFSFTTPLQTALTFLAVVAGMDALVVAPFFEKSFAMFASPLGMWLPLALIFCVTYFTGMLCRRGVQPS